MCSPVCCCIWSNRRAQSIFPLHRLARVQRRSGVVQNGFALKLHVHHAGGPQCAVVGRLAAALGVKGRFIQRHGEAAVPGRAYQESTLAQNSRRYAS